MPKRLVIFLFAVPFALLGLLVPSSHTRNLEVRFIGYGRPPGPNKDWDKIYFREGSVWDAYGQQLHAQDVSAAFAVSNSGPHTLYVEASASRHPRSTRFQVEPGHQMIAYVRIPTNHIPWRLQVEYFDIRSYRLRTWLSDLLQNNLRLTRASHYFGTPIVSPPFTFPPEISESNKPAQSLRRRNFLEHPVFPYKKL